MRRISLILLILAFVGCGSGSNPANASAGTPSAVDDGGGAGRPGEDGAAQDAKDSPEGASHQDAGSSSTADGSSSPDATSDGAAGGIGPYGGDGPAQVGTASVQVPAPSGAFTVTAYYPESPGPHPAVILSSGFFQTGLGYAPYAKRMASWGIVTLTRDDPGLSGSSTSVASDVSYMVTSWLPAAGADGGTAPFGAIDASRVGLAGHSRGGQVALLAAEGDAKGHVRGVFGLDPVDTSMNGSPEARTQIGTIGVPVAFIGETTDSAANGCAPATDNYQVLFQAGSSPVVAITAVDADHTMFEDPANCTFCTLCTAGTAKPATVLAYSVRYMTAFFARELLGDASVGAAFTGAGANQDVAAGLVTIVSK